MAEIIEMPKLSDTMTVGTLVKWLKKEGDKVAPGEELCEVETDKATMPVENFAHGVLLKHYAAAGSQLPVGAAICAIGKAGEEAPAAPTVAPKAAAAPAKPAAPAVPAATTSAPSAPVAAAAPKVPAPVAQPATANQQTATASGARVKASPLAKKLAVEKGVALAGVTGSGPSGRIVRADVMAAAANPKAVAPAASGAASVASLSGPIGPDETLAVSNMRATIARRLLESTNGVPHFYVEIEVDAGPLADMREGLNAALGDVPPAKGGGKFTVNDFILKGAVEALRRVPAANSSWLQSEQGPVIQRHGSVHLAFGVAIEDGLLTPVIRNADSKSLRQIAAEAKELIGKARAKKLTPAEMSGSTFTK